VLADSCGEANLTRTQFSIRRNRDMRNLLNFPTPLFHDRSTADKSNALFQGRAARASREFFERHRRALIPLLFHCRENGHRCFSITVTGEIRQRTGTATRCSASVLSSLDYCISSSSIKARPFISILGDQNIVHINTLVFLSRFGTNKNLLCLLFI
jgi:hypothetical protein